MCIVFVTSSRLLFSPAPARGPRASSSSRPDGADGVLVVVLVAVVVVTRTHARRKRWCVRDLDLDLDLDEKRRDRSRARDRANGDGRRAPRVTTTDRSIDGSIALSDVGDADAGRRVDRRVCARRWCARAVVTTRTTWRKIGRCRRRRRARHRASRRVVAGVEMMVMSGGARAIARSMMTTMDDDDDEGARAHRRSVRVRSRAVEYVVFDRVVVVVASSSSAAPSSHPPTRVRRPSRPTSPGRGIHGEEALMHSRGL